MCCFVFTCKYGFFSDDGLEYIITNPKTPRPWSNIISNGKYSILITQTGSGYSWGKNAMENRITSFAHDYVKDDLGKYIYIRDDDTGEFWSATYKPVDKCGNDYKVIHGLGYTIFKHTFNKIESQLKVFLSKDDMIEFFEISIKNKSNKPRKISVFTYAELSLSNFPEENKSFHNLFMENEFNRRFNSLIARKNFWGIMDECGECNNQKYKYTFFMSSTEKIFSYECSRENFIGMYGSLKNPKVMYDINLSNTHGKNLDSVSCIHNKFNVKAYGEIKFCNYMGICDGVEELNKISQKYRTVKFINDEFVNFNKYIMEFINCEFVKTPNESINLMVNIWCKYQTLMCRFFSKASYYQINKGTGYRDNLQDSLIFLNTNNHLLREQILFYASLQFEDGSAPHYFLDESKCFLNTFSSDDNLWFAYVTIIYVKETFDLEILDCEVGYANSCCVETVYEHLKKSINYSIDNISKNGLSKILNHDWNDSISNFKGESIFVSEFLYLNLKEFSEICFMKNDFGFLNRIETFMGILKKAVNEIGFYKNHYLRCVSDKFNLGGDDGKIFLMPQAFAVISGISQNSKCIKAMNEVYFRLNTDSGLKILTPPFKHEDKNIGYITRYAQGTRENGSIYYHSCMWGILAFIMVDRIDLAEEIIEKILPPNKSSEIDVYKIEPYVMPSSVEGDYSENFKRGNWSFNTGSSVWFHRIINNYVIGVRGTLNGLLISPKPFLSWNKFFVRKKFRDATFNINFETYDGEELEIFCNGKRIKGNLIKDICKGVTYEVNVRIGKRF